MNGAVSSLPRETLNRTLLEVIGGLGMALEILGVLTIVLGAATATATFVRRLTRRGSRVEAYASYRASFARAVLLGLEFLVAGDIIRTVVVEPTLPNVGSLAVVVLIRTFLSITLEMEVSGRWPWQRAGESPDRQV